MAPNARNCRASSARHKRPNALLGASSPRMIRQRVHNEPDHGDEIVQKPILISRAPLNLRPSIREFYRGALCSQVWWSRVIATVLRHRWQPSVERFPDKGSAPALRLDHVDIGTVMKPTSTEYLDRNRFCCTSGSHFTAAGTWPTCASRRRPPRIESRVPEWTLLGSWRCVVPQRTSYRETYRSTLSCPTVTLWRTKRVNRIARIAAGSALRSARFVRLPIHSIYAP